MIKFVLSATDLLHLANNPILAASAGASENIVPFAVSSQLP